MHAPHSLAVYEERLLFVFLLKQLVLHYDVAGLLEASISLVEIVALLQHAVEHFQELQEVLVIQVIDDVSYVHQVQLWVAYPWLPLLDGLGVQEEAFLGLRIKFKELFIE